MITHRKAAATLFAFAMTTTSAWAGNACIQDDDLTALRATALQQQLMVAGYACHDAAEYNRFVEIYRSQLVSADASLMAYFIHRNASTGSDDYNAFKTKLANIAAIRSANDTGEFCGHARVAFRAALATEKASLKDLVAVQSNTAQPVCADVKTAAVPTPTPKPAQMIAANAPVPKPELQGIPASAIAPKPLTAEALAQMYPGDPPPFSLPTTPPSANIPPVAAPTARVAVNDLARPAASGPIHAMQEAQAPFDEASDGLDIAGPVEAALSAAPAFAQMAEAPAELAATAMAQKQPAVTAGQVVAAHAAGQLLQAPAAMAAAAPAAALSDAEMQSLALSGVTAAEANAPVEAAPQRASAPRYAAAQPQYNAQPNAADSDDADDLPPLPRDSYARPDARVASNDGDRYGPDNYADNRSANNRDDDAYAPPSRQTRSAPQPASYRYYSDRFGNRYAEDSRGQQYFFDPRRGRWQPMDDGYGSNAPSTSAYPSYAYSPYYRSTPPGYYGR